MSDQELEAQLRKRIERRIKERNGFYIHLVAFIGINIFLWVLWLMTSPGALAWPLFATLPWSVGLIINGMVVYQNSGRATERRKDHIRREVELEKARLGLKVKVEDKPKRDHPVRLSDDGELITDDHSDARRDTISARK